MSLKSIFLAVVVEDSDVPVSVAGFASYFGGHHSAHLRVGIAAPMLQDPTGLLTSEFEGMLHEVNARRNKRAQKLAQDIQGLSAATGVAIRTEVIHTAYQKVRHRIVEMARVSDMALLSRTHEMSPSERTLAEDILFNGGRPMMIAPREPENRNPFLRIIVAWDGSGRAARAVGDALPLISQAASVEIVTVADDPSKSDRIEGAELAQHLSRYCGDVSISELPRLERSVGRALGSYMSLREADLLVMGGYAHSRLRQFVLGGATSDILTRAPFPVLMSY
jgi:nucleotide-binding universal stress UspA family protein